MYGARAYLAYIGYGVTLLFQDEILRDNGNFWSPKINYRSCIAINIGPSLSYHVIVSHQKWKFLSRPKRKPPSKLEDGKNECVCTHFLYKNCFYENRVVAHFSWFFPPIGDEPIADLMSISKWKRKTRKVFKAHNWGQGEVRNIKTWHKIKESRLEKSY